MQGGFVVLDFGSQFTQLIARRLREIHVYSEILPFDAPLEKIKELKPIGIFLSGGPSSVSDEGSPKRDINELAQIAPLFGICYGMQLIAASLGGVVEPSGKREYGFNLIKWSESLSPYISSEQKVWMSHGDIVRVPPPGFKILATSESGHPAAIKNDRIWALQFHPEVTHTDLGINLIEAFCFQKCEAVASWDPPHIVSHLLEKIKTQVGSSDHVLCGLSGGVDSSVVAALLSKALGAERVHCVFVNNGLLRNDWYQEVFAKYRKI